MTGLVNEISTFQANVSGGTQPYTFFWDLDNDGEYDDSNSKTVNFSTIFGGIHFIKLRVTDKGGREAEDEININIPLTEANITLKDVSYSPINPTANDNITFTVLLENTGDNVSDSNLLQLKWHHRDEYPWHSWGEWWTLEGHSKKNLIISTGYNTVDEGNQSFEIVRVENYPNSINTTLATVYIEIKPSPPEIYFSTTASNVVTFGEYTEKTTFEAGDKIYVYYEYTNVNHENIIDIYHTISVHHKESWVSYSYYYNNYDDDKQVSDSERWSRWWFFNTYDWYDGPWPKGKYQVDIGLLDEITGITTISTIYFTLT